MKRIRDRRWGCPALANRVVATLSVATLLWGGCPVNAQSPPIIPAVDGTGTQITQDSDQFLITGGQVSGNGRNLFHSFTEFGLDRGQIATFLSRPTIQNILTRVSGGNVSVIDGLLRVTGGKSHLFLMNPAGIVFGANARLDVPGSLTATTATGIGLGGNQWFTSVGTPDYAQLTGNPTTFAFATIAPGAIANFGQLAVPAGQSLTLLGGSILNLGTLSAPGGQITVSAVPGGNWVRLSQAGSLLSLDIQPLPTGFDSFTPAQPIPTLPQLLTGGTLTNANQVTVNPDGSLRLVGSTLDLPTTPGSTLISGQISVESNTLPTPGAITLLGQTVALVNATVDASGLQGGSVRIGGDYQGRGSLPNAQRTFIDPGTVIRANGQNPEGARTFGDGGRVIVWSDQVTQFYGQIEARGGDRAGDGGFVEVSGKRHLTYQGETSVAAAGRSGTLLLDPENIWIVPDGFGQDDTIATTSNSLTISASDFSGTLTLSKNVVESVEGDIILAATNNIEFLLPAGAALEFNENVTSITLTADGDGDGVGSVLGSGIGLVTSPLATTDITVSGAAIALGSIDTTSTSSQGGSVFISSTGSLTVGSIDTSSQSEAGGAVTLLSGGNLAIDTITTTALTGAGEGGVFANATGNITLNTVNTASQVGDGGFVTLSGADLTVGTINTASQFGAGGSVNLSGATIGVGRISTTSVARDGGGVVVLGSGNVATSTIDTTSNGGMGGTVSVRSDQAIQVGGIVTRSTAPSGKSGDVALAGNGNIAAGDITTNAPNGTAGEVLIASQQGSITTGNLATGGAIAGGGVTLLAPTIDQDIRFGWIGTGSRLGVGGDVLIQAGRFVRGTATIGATTIAPATDVDALVSSATIYTVGAIAPGLVIIEHGGGGNRAPFIVGAETSNGLVGGIITGIDNVTASPPTIFRRDYTSPAGWITIVGAENADAETPGNDEVQAFEIEPDAFDMEEFDFDFAYNGEGDNTFDSDRANDLDDDVSAEFEDYLELPDEENITTFTPEEELQNIQTATGVRPALIYLNYAPVLVNTTLPSPPIAKRRLRGEAVPASLGAADSGLDLTGLEPTAIDQAHTAQFDRDGQLAQAPSKPRSPLTPQPTDQLEVVMVTADGRSQRKIVAGATRAQVQATVQQFLLDISDPRKTRSKTYLANAQQLYRWLVQPIEAELVNRKISNLAFIADTGLRFIPLAALHDGKQFLVEKYSIGLMPSLTLTDTRFVSLKNEPVLAMGASEFSAQPELPAVPTELSLITQQIRTGRSYLNQEFTLDNLRTQRQQEHFKIVHLATHGEFQAGAIRNSYIQLWDTQLRLDQIRQLGWSNPPVELLVLSACRTALGSDEAELGFAGFAVQSGVKSAIASLWSVSDEGTLGLMTEFYRQLDFAPIRAEALRQAQIAMAQGRVKFVNGQLQDATGRLIPLPPSLSQIGDRDLTHPYYWAAFTMIGSPW